MAEAQFLSPAPERFVPQTRTPEQVEADKQALTAQYNELRSRLQRGLLTDDQRRLFLQLEQDALRQGKIYPTEASKEGTVEPATVPIPGLIEAQQGINSIEQGINSGGELGSTLGEIGGALAWNMLPGGTRTRQAIKGFGRPFAHAGGAAAGYTAQRYLEGVPHPAQGAEWEALFTGLPVALQETLKDAAIHFFRSGAGGKKLRRHAAANEAAELSQKIFNPPKRSAVTDAYSRVYNSNMPVYFDGPELRLNRFRANLDARDYQLLNRKMLDADQDIRRTYNVLMYGTPNVRMTEQISRTASSTRKIRQEHVQTIENIQRIKSEHGSENVRRTREILPPSTPNRTRVNNLPIEKIDRLRQYLNDVWVDADGSIENLTSELRDSVDDLVENTLSDPRTVHRLARERNMTPEQVKMDLDQARHSHFLRVTADKFDALLNQRSIRREAGEDARFWTVNLSNLDTAMTTKPNSIAKEVRRRMDRLPGTFEAYQGMIKRLQRRYRYIEVEDATGRGVTGITSRMFSNAIVSPVGRALLENAILEGRGKLSFNTLALITNIARRYALRENEDKAEALSRIGHALGGAVNNAAARVGRAFAPPQEDRSPMGGAPDRFGTFPPLGP